MLLENCLLWPVLCKKGKKSLRSAIRASSSSSASDTESGGDRWSIDTVHRKGDAYAEAVEEAQTLASAESHLYSKGVSYDGQLTDAISNEWREAGYSEEQISQ